MKSDLTRFLGRWKPSAFAVLRLVLAGLAVAAGSVLFWWLDRRWWGLGGHGSQNLLWSELERALLASAVLLGLWRGLEGRRVSWRAVLGRRSLLNVGGGFLIGALLLCLGIGLLAALGDYRMSSVDLSAGCLRQLGKSVLLLALVGVAEEVFFRGICFRVIEEGFGSWAALIVSSAFFGGAHLANDNATLLSAFAIALEAGVLLGAVYMVTRSLLIVIGIHWAWNLFEGPIFGTPVSGYAVPGPVFHGVLSGSPRWTGGEFGPEGGLAILLVCLAAGLTALILAIRQGKLLAAPWRSFDKTQEPEPVRAD